MAEKRMFAKKIIDSDAFLDMPLSAQALYFHLNMRADDDGFVSNPKRIVGSIGASVDDLKVLLTNRYVIGFESGVIVITHWRLHNTLKADRYHPTDFQEEFSSLELMPNKAYTDCIASQQSQIAGNKMEPIWSQTGTTDKISIDKISVSVKEEEDHSNPHPMVGITDSSITNQVRHPHGEYGWVHLSKEEYACLLKEMGPTELDRCITYIDEAAQSNGNKNGWKDWNLIIRRCHREKWGIHCTTQQAYPGSESGVQYCGYENWDNQ